MIFVGESIEWEGIGDGERRKKEGEEGDGEDSLLIVWVLYFESRTGIVMCCVMIWELVSNYQAQGTPISVKPVFNYMVRFGELPSSRQRRAPFAECLTRSFFHLTFPIPLSPR